MPIFTFYAPYNMVNSLVWRGNVTGATSSRYTISDGYRTSVYTGQFSYSGDMPTGIWQGYTEYSGSNVVINATGFNVNANVAANFIKSNQIQGAFELILKDGGTIVGSGGSDTLVGYGGQTYFTGGGGNDTLVGSNGLNIASYNGKSSEYTITTSGLGAYVISDHVSNREGIDTLTNIERLKFSNTSIALDINGNAGEAYRIYEAAFNRKPDADGLGYWIAQLDKGTTLKSAAEGFLGSAEFKALYGSSPTNSAFVESLYKNILDRAGEKGGVDYWTGQLNSGVSRADVLVGFSESPENQKNVIGSIQNGIEYKEWLG